MPPEEREDESMYHAPTVVSLALLVLAILVFRSCDVSEDQAVASHADTSGPDTTGDDTGGTSYDDRDH